MSQLKYEDVVLIEHLNNAGESARGIAKKLGRSHTTVSRELNRCKGGYSKKAALDSRKQRRSVANQKRRKISRRSFVWWYIRLGIQRYRSPEQIAGKLGKEYDIHINHCTVYRYLYENEYSLAKKYLRRGGKKYRKNGLLKYQIDGRISIDERPENINERRELGHWEGDTIIGEHHRGAILTQVERVSGYLIAAKLMDKTAFEVVEKTRDSMEKIPVEGKKSITYDNGKEFSEHTMITHFTGMRVYFAHPYSSRERGTNENTNGLLRQFIPKSSDFGVITASQLQHYVNLINNRPRKRLNWLTPKEFFCGAFGLQI